MAYCLRNRFVRSTASLRKLLHIFGLDFASHSKWAKTWSGICYSLVFQAGLYVLLDRSHDHIYDFFISLEHLIPILDRTIRFFSISLLHLVLVLKLRQALNSFCNRLESVDFRSHQPDLTKIRISSIAGVVWILLLCNAQTCCAMYWDIFARRTKPLIFWLEIIQQIIRVESVLFLDVSVVVFWVCGQIIVTYYEILDDDLTSCASAKNEFVRFASISPQLSAAASLLCSQFAFVLLINCFHSFCCLLFFSDGIVGQVRDRDLKVLIIWDVIVIVDCLVRLWLLCQTADQIRYAALKCIRSLRRLRDEGCVGATHTSERIKVTLVMVESIKTLPNFQLFGLTTLSKRLTLRVLETAAAYILMLFEIRRQKRV